MKTQIYYKWNNPMRDPRTINERFIERSNERTSKQRENYSSEVNWNKLGKKLNWNINWKEI